ncbi:MAG: hypothetical protein J6R85_02715 [Lentisphaeria bacterium]|nr:hypothetical protein [Lentisphaeria bacterium]
MDLKKILFFLAVPGMMLLAGCEAFQQAWDEALHPEEQDSNGEGFFSEYKPKYVLNFNQLVRYPRAGDLETKIRTFEGKEIWINTNPNMTSRHIRQIRMTPRLDAKTYNLALQLSDTGARIWTMMALQGPGDSFALMLDGHYFCSFVPAPLADEDANWVMIDYPFDEVTAKGLVKYSRKNYDHFNPSATSLW